MTVPPQAIRAYALCVGVCGLGYAFSPLDKAFPFSVARALLWLAVVGVGVTTFRWADTIGYPARDAKGNIQAAHVVRSLVMTGVMALAVIMASLPMFVIVGELTRN